MTEFDIQVQCPACGAAFRVPRIRAGAREACPVCNHAVPVPVLHEPEEADGEPVEEAPEGAPAEEAEEPAWAEQDEGAPAAADLSPDEPYVVYVQDDQRFNPLAVGPLVSEATGVNPAQAKMDVVRGHGVLAEGVAAEVAADLAKRLTNIQVPARVVPMSAVPLVERELPLIRVHDVAADGLTLQVDPRGTLRSLPWALVAAVFCTREAPAPRAPARFPGAGDYYGDAGGRRAWIGASGPARAQARPVVCSLLVRGRRGSLYSMKFDELGVNYNYLGERRGPSGSRNFALFLSDVMRRCPQAVAPASARAVAAGHGDRAVVVRDRSDYERYQRWVLCCAAGRRRGHGPAPGSS